MKLYVLCRKVAPGSWFKRRKSSNKAWVSTIPWGDIDILLKIII